MTPLSYPIEAVLPQIRQALSQHRLIILTAQPGAGKTTQVPLALLQEPWLNGKAILMLEPRRLAARAAARRMSELLHESVGRTVGYRTRLDTKISSATRLEVVTEGVLTRMLQHDPSLSHYGLVIFDEFHERSLQGDLGLAFCLESRHIFREELRLLIMSATLDTETLSRQLNQAPVITCEGKMFPIETRYAGKPERKEFLAQMANMVARLLRTETGSLLVFLPGAGEIRRIEGYLKTLSIGEGTLIAPLYGDLPPEAQDQAILPPPAGWRKVVLSTNLAETSLTIEGIRIVVDSGLMRVSRYDTRSGMSRLVTTMVSQQSAEQRRGRAGRTEPGLCVRFWSEAEQRTLIPRNTPEILETDLTPLALELAQWGVRDPSTLQWLDPPPSGTLAGARQLLHALGALDAHGSITDHGGQMAELPMHPRFAHMIVKGHMMGYGALACDLAAMLSEGYRWRPSGAQATPDLRTWMEHLHGGPQTQEAGHWPEAGRHRMRQVSRAWQQGLHRTPSPAVSHTHRDAIGILLSMAYPDRIAQRQAEGTRRYRLANGRGAIFPQPDPLEQEEWLVIADLHQLQSTARISLAAPLSRKDLMTSCSHLIQSEEVIVWDESANAVLARQRQRLGELIVTESRLPDPDPDAVLAALLEGLRQAGLSCLPWTPFLKNWQARVQFLRRATSPQSPWPDVSDDTLLATLNLWLGPYLHNLTSLDQLRRLDLAWPLQALLSPEQRRTIDTLAPTHLTVPTGSAIALDYQSGDVPVLAVRLQELFGMTETPRLGGGTVPVMIHLLSPARRPVQVTQDLHSFWKTGYVAVKKELKGRYPKHFWPDDPLQAPPTRGIRKS